METAKKSNQRTKKDPLDRYYTPAWVTEVLVENWPFPDGVQWAWEPCNGRGHIAHEIMRTMDIPVWQSDVDKTLVYSGILDNGKHDDVWGGRNSGPSFPFDFLSGTLNMSRHYQRLLAGHLESGDVAIITNPPYSIPGATAADFVRKALEYTPYVAMLLRLSWLEACEDRKSIFAEQPPAEVWILPRVKFEGPNTNGGSPSSTSAWFIWKPGSTKTKLMWVEAKP